MIKLVFARSWNYCIFRACSNQSESNNSKSQMRVDFYRSSGNEWYGGMNHEGMVPSSMKDAAEP